MTGRVVQSDGERRKPKPLKICFGRYRKDTMLLPRRKFLKALAIAPVAYGFANSVLAQVGGGNVTEWELIADYPIRARRNDRIDGAIRLKTNHDQENLEDERALVKVNGELYAMAANYWGYTIPLHIPRAPGDCLIQVFCDENSPGTKDNFAQIYAEVNGTFAFDPDSKAYASRTALATMIMGTGSGAALTMSGVAASSPPGMALVALGVTFGVLTGILGKISNDPPDFNYAETFDPQFGFPPILTKGG